MNDRPLLDRLSPTSHRALLIWCISYALNNRHEIDPETLANMRQGDRAQHQTAEILTRYGLDLTRQTANR